MQELGELNGHSEAFTRRGLRVVAMSVDGVDDTAKMQSQFPNLTVLGDPERKMTNAFQALHQGVGPGGSDLAAPTTYLIDAEGTIRWRFRPDRFIVRLTPEEVLAAVDQHLAAN